MDIHIDVPRQMAKRLDGHSPGDQSLHDILAQLPYKVRVLAPSAYLLREGQIPERCAFIIDGFAYRQKLTTDGEREIVSILVPGDWMDVQNIFLNESDHDVQALTSLTVAEVPIPAMREMVFEHPGIGRALWITTLVEASIHREWLLNIGRRSARVRLAHLICEFSVRLSGDMTNIKTYELPMTQEQLGDALGLTPVHVNRVLKALESEGLIERQKRLIAIIDWQRLSTVGEFNSRYLHLDQVRF